MNKKQPDNKKMWMRGILIIVSVLFLVNAFTTMNKNDANKVKKSDYTEFAKRIQNNEIKEVVITEKGNGPWMLSVVPKEGKEYKINAIEDPTLVNKLIDKDVKVDVIEEDKPSFLYTLLISWGPMLLFIGVWIYFMKKMSGGQKGIFSFNKSKAQLIDPDKIGVSFSDVIGCDEAKQEVQEFVDFLKNPDKFSKLGGRVPRGLLLTGPAGTGKTLLAKALAKESGVPFYSVSGSEFIEMFVGVGASRVRDMFETAKKAAPCVLFIDEIDAIGGKRNSGAFGGGGSDEREQTLNQILVELDGVDTNKGIILVGATNRPEVLDPALRRPGRIDREITVSLPDVNGREGILTVHSKNVPLASEVDMRKIARGTPGFSGAELANVINEAAIYAARRNSKFVEQIDLEKAKDKVMMGIERPSLAMSDEDKRDTAYHEAGHAVIAKLLKDADPVYKVSIIPRGRALGVTMQLPEKDRWSYKKQFLLDRVAILMGGRAAEELFCNTMTNGASNDIAVATSTVRSMVQEWGMSALGPMAYGERGNSFLGGGQINTNGLSQETLREVDQEVNNTIKFEYERAKTLLKENESKVEAMTNALMEVETLDDWQIENIMKDRHFNDKIGYLEFKEEMDKKAAIDREKNKKFVKQATEEVIESTDDVAPSV